MLSPSRVVLSENIFSATWNELKKFPAFLSFKIKEKVDAKVKMMKYIAGEDVHSSEPIKAWKKKHKELYWKILQYQQEQENKKRAKRLEGLAFHQRWMFHLREAAANFRKSAAVEAGKMALLQHCAASHAAEVAIAQNIDLKNIRMVLEKQKRSEGGTVEAGEEEVVVGYIDAPNTSEEELYAFAAAVQQACPVSRHMAITWRPEPSSSATPSSMSSSFTSHPGMEDSRKTEEGEKPRSKDHDSEMNKDGAEESKKMQNNIYSNPPNGNMGDDISPPPKGMPGVPLSSRSAVLESQDAASSTAAKGWKNRIRPSFADEDHSFTHPGISSPRKKQ